MSKFVSFRYLDDDNAERDITLNVSQIVSILPYEEDEQGTLITLTNDEEFLVTADYADVVEQTKSW